MYCSIEVFALHIYIHLFPDYWTCLCIWVKVEYKLITKYTKSVKRVRDLGLSLEQ